MKKNRVHLSTPKFSNKESERLVQLMSLQNFDAYTETVGQFETDLEKYLAHDSFVSCLSSGTAAIHMALMLTGVQKDDEVLCQSFTYSATVNPIIYQRAKPVFIDSETDTWNMCPEKLEEKILEKKSHGKIPKAIIVVHLYGMPAKIERIQSIAKKYGIILIEDAAEALGSRYNGQPCGTFGDYGILSFNNNKLITTLGGGAIICKSEAKKNRAIYLATQAKEERPFYHHTEIGYNYRMSPVAAAIGIGQLANIEGHLLERKEVHELYKRLLSKSERINLFSEPDKKFDSNFWLNCIQVKSEESMYLLENIMNTFKEGHIDSRPLWKPMHLQPVFSGYEYGGGETSEKLFNSGLCLPSGFLTEIEKERIVQAIQSSIL